MQISLVTLNTTLHVCMAPRLSVRSCALQHQDLLFFLSNGSRQGQFVPKQQARHRCMRQLCTCVVAQNIL